MPELSVSSEGGRFVLRTDLYAFLPRPETSPVSTGSLKPAFEPEQPFENPDGSPIVMDRDLLGRPRGAHPLPGPFEEGGDTFFF